MSIVQGTTGQVLRSTLLGVAVLGMSVTAQADWSLDQEASTLNFLTSKAGSITEINTFTELDGQVISGGLASLEISLASVDTSIPIRDERMQNMLFNLDDYPLATVEIDVSQDDLEGMAHGENVQTHKVAALSLNGVTNSVETDLSITRLADGGLLVSLQQPLVINAGSFGLAEGVEELREVAGLPQINNNVIVTFLLVYQPG